MLLSHPGSRSTVGKGLFVKTALRGAARNMSIAIPAANPKTSSERDVLGVTFEDTVNRRSLANGP